MKKFLIIFIPVLVIGAAVFFFMRDKGGSPQYRTEKIVKGDITSAVTATGNVNAVTTVLVGTQVSGTIKEIFADFNSRVRKGQLIAQIDPSLFEAQVDQARAALVTAKANLAKAEVAVTDTRRTLERNRQLFARNLIAQSDLDAAATNYDSAVAQVNANKAQVEQSAAALRTSETNLKYTRILSPVNGTVVSRNVDVGQTVAASFQTPTLFNIAQDLTKMQIDSNVAEADIGKMKVGQPVEFTVDAYPDSPFHGSVSEIRNAPISVQNVVTYDVVIKVANPELKLKPGMTANVSIVVSSKKDVLKIPNTALRFKPSEKRGKPDQKESGGREKGSAVWILENNKPKRVPVTIGISDGSFTELLSDNMKEGQELIVESLVKPKNQQQPTGPRMF